MPLTVPNDSVLTPEEGERARAFAAVVRDLLERHRIKSAWRSSVAVVVTPGQPPRVVARAALARELRDDDLGQLAHEVIVRKVKPNEVLVLVISDALTKCWAMAVERSGRRAGGDVIVPGDRALLELLEEVTA